MYCLDHAERPQPDNLLSFILYGLVFLEYHLQFFLHPCSFASYFYSCKILQPYDAVRMHSDTVQCILLYQCFSNENSHKNITAPQQIVVLYLLLPHRIRQLNTCELALTYTDQYVMLHMRAMLHIRAFSYHCFLKQWNWFFFCL